MAASIKISDRDRGWKRLERQLVKLNRPGAFTLVGVQGNEAAAGHRAGGTTVAEVATVHEFGAILETEDGRPVVIPQRSFIRAAIDEYANKLQRLATLLGRGVILGKFQTQQALELLGEQAVGIMKKRIADGLQPPNSPATIAQKGSSKPLIDTGQLRGSITHKIEGR